MDWWRGRGVRVCDFAKALRCVPRITTKPRRISSNSSRFICRPYDQFGPSPWSTIDEQTRALELHVRVSMRLGGALVVVWVALLAIQASGDNASLPACEGVYMNQKAGSNFGNHFDGLTDLASVALACGLPMAIESAGLLDAICSRPSAART